MRKASTVGKSLVILYCENRGFSSDQIQSWLVFSLIYFLLEENYRLYEKNSVVRASGEIIGPPSKNPPF